MTPYPSAPGGVDRGRHRSPSHPRSRRASLEPDRARRLSAKRRGGFTLVEIVVAIGILAVSLMGIIAISGTAIDSSREAEENFHAVQIAANAFDALRSTAFAATTTFPPRYFGDQAQPLDGSQSADAIYRLDIEATESPARPGPINPPRPRHLPVARLAPPRPVGQTFHHHRYSHPRNVAMTATPSPKTLLRSSRRAAFTLVEILVATAISSTILLAIFALLGSSLTLFNRTSHAIGQSADARFALERISADLSGIVITSGTIQCVENHPSLYSGIPSYNAADKNGSLFFVTPSLNAGAGDLCVVAYRLNRRSLALERAMVDSASAWSNSPKYLASGYPSLDWEPVAGNAVEFEIHLFTYLEASLPELPATPSVANWDSEADGRPALASVNISFIDPPTASRIREEGGLGVSDSPITAPVIFTRIIDLPR